MAARRLWPADAQRIQDILRLRSQLGAAKLSAQELQDLEERIARGLSNLNCVFWGDAHPNGQLRCLLLQVLDPRWPDTWNAALLATDGSTPSWNYRQNGLDALWRVAFTWGRSKGRQHVVWSLPLAWARTMRHTAKTTDEWLKYDVQDLDVVPAGELPSDDFKRWVFGETVKTYPVLLRRASLKQSQPDAGSQPPLA